MATSRSKKRGLPVDYEQLNNFSSTMLYDTARKSKKGNVFEVEKVMTKRRLEGRQRIAERGLGQSLGINRPMTP